MTGRMRARLPWITGVVSAGAVILWTLAVAPRYRSEALLRVQKDPAAGGLSDALTSIPGAGALGLSRDEVETEIGVLTSQRVLGAVIDSLALIVRRPRGERSAVGTVAVRTAFPLPNMDGSLTFRPSAEGRWTVEARAEGKGPFEASVPAVTPGDTVRVGPVWIRFSPSAEVVAAAKPVRLRVLPRYQVEEQLVERMDVRRQAIGSQLISVTLDDTDRELAAAAVQLMLAEYLRFTAGTETTDLSSTVSELRRKVAEQEGELAAAEDALRRYQEAKGLLVPDEQATAQVKRYASLQVERDGIDVEREAIQRLLAMIEARAAGAEGPAAYRQLAAYPTLISNQAIQNLLEALLELENLRSERRSVRADESREVRQVTERITELEESLRRIGRQYLEGLEQQRATLAQALDSLDRSLRGMPDDVLGYYQRLRRQKVADQAYVALQRQLQQVALQQTLRLDRVRIVDAPMIADVDDPQFPKLGVHFVLALILGVAVGLLTRASLGRAARAEA